MPKSRADHARSLLAKTNIPLHGKARDFGWMTLGQLLVPAIQALQFLLLAAILSSSDFGTWVYPSTLLGLILMASEVGLSTSQVADPAGGYRLVTLWAPVFAAIMLIGAFARYSESPGEAYLVASLVPIVPIVAACGIQRGILTVAGHFRAQVVAEMAGGAGGLTAAIIASTMGAGAWTFIFAAYIRQCVVLLFQRAVVAKLPLVAAEGSRSRWFSAPYVSFYAIVFLASNIDYLLATHLLNVSDRGVYFLAFNLATLIPYRFTTIVNRLALPRLVAKDGDRGERAALLMTIASASLGIIAYLTILFGSLLPRHLLGRWQEVISPLILLTSGVFGAALASMMAVIIVGSGGRWKLTVMSLVEIGATAGVLLLFMPANVADFARLVSTTMLIRGLLWLLLFIPKGHLTDMRDTLIASGASLITVAVATAILPHTSQAGGVTLLLIALTIHIALYGRLIKVAHVDKT